MYSVVGLDTPAMWALQDYYFKEGAPFAYSLFTIDAGVLCPRERQQILEGYIIIDVIRIVYT